MTLKMNEEEVLHAESADRRLFLRNALRMSGVAALLLTATSRKLLAGSLTLNSQELDAARRAQQAQGAPHGTAAQSSKVSSAYNGCDCSGCSGCTSSCTGCNGCSSCSGCTGCQGTAK